MNRVKVRQPQTYFDESWMMQAFLAFQVQKHPFSKLDLIGQILYKKF